MPTAARSSPVGPTADLSSTTKERVEQPGIGERTLPAVFVDVQQPALPTRLRRDLALVDNGRDSVPP